MPDTTIQQVIEQLIDEWRDAAQFESENGRGHIAATLDTCADQLAAILAGAVPYEQQKEGEAGVDLIAAERRRQIEREGWSFEHDDGHTYGELSLAASAYATVASAMERGAEANEFDADMMIAEGDWPFDESSWKPSDDPVRNLVKAGALIAAEIDRIRRRHGAR